MAKINSQSVVSDATVKEDVVVDEPAAEEEKPEPKLSTPAKKKTR